MAIGKRIVYTRHDGGVTLTCPTQEVFRALQVGIWARKPNGFVQDQIEKQIADGRDPDASRRFALALVKGGVTEREVWTLIRDRDCLHKGKLHELHDLDDLPGDRWFRDAWRRSHNGGPIGIDLEAARQIQWQRLFDTADWINKRRMRALRPLSPIAIDHLRAPIERAASTDELKRIWPDELHRPT